MQITPMSIEGAYVVEPAVHADARGSFAEWFRGDLLAQACGRRLEVAQANVSVSAVGTIRGIHFAQLPPGQAKHVSCMRGAVFDVVVDLRVGSPTYGRWEGVELDDASRRSLFISEGPGHGFAALAEDTVVSYLCSTTYNPGREHGVDPLDPAIGIDWPDVGVTPQLSEKDAAAGSLEEARLEGRLPTYDEWRAWTAERGARG